MSILLRLLLPVAAILVVGFVVMRFLSREPDQENGATGPDRRQVQREKPQVQAVRLARTSYQVELTSQGVVRAHNSASLTPRVSGRVMRIHPNFEDGAFFRAGEVLLELDPADFNSAVASAEAAVARAEAALVQELARAEQAVLDWNELYPDKIGEASDLVQRKPQLKEAEANVAAAKASLIKAQRDLEHTKVIAPYDGCVLSRAVGPGQSVGTGTTLGEIFSTDYAEIRLPLSSEDMRFISLANGNLPNEVPVTLKGALDATSTTVWQGKVVRSEGILDESSRELFLIARVEDPYGLQAATPPLRIGQPVTARIKGDIIPDVFVIPRRSLRSANQVVLVDPADSVIHHRRFTPLWSNVDELVVAEGVEEDWWLVTSGVTMASPGTEVLVIPAGNPARAESSGSVEEEPGA